MPGGSDISAEFRLREFEILPTDRQERQHRAARADTPALPARQEPFVLGLTRRLDRRLVRAITVDLGFRRCAESARQYALRTS